MFTSTPQRTLCQLLVTFVACVLFNSNVAFSEDADVVAQGTRISVNQQLQRMRLSLARIRRTVDTLTANNTAVKSGITDVKNSLVSLNQRVVTGTSVAPAEPTTSQTVIGSNKPSPAYMAFDFYPGVRAEAVVQHKNTGVFVVFRTLEGSKLLLEYKLDFSFEGRSADQKSADAMMISACLTHFHRAADAANGGSFYIYPSSDDKLGLLCSSVVNR